MDARRYVLEIDDREAALEDRRALPEGGHFVCGHCEDPFPLDWPERVMSEHTGEEYCGTECMEARHDELF